jgi:preprotein translocase subunit SecD
MSGGFEVQRRDWILLAIIALLLAAALWIDILSPVIAIWRPLPENYTEQQYRAIRATTLRLGLDLQGGMQVILEAQGDPTTVTGQSVEVARDIISSRVNQLGVNEAALQVQGGNRIVVELPGVFDQQQALAAMQNTGFLEFVATGDEFLEPGTVISTTYGLTPEQIAAITRTKVYQTVVTGNDLALSDIQAGADRLTGKPIVRLGFNAAGKEKFATWTAANVGKPLAIVLDKKVVSSPVIQEPITDGKAMISGGKVDFNEAERIALLLQYGALPVPLKEVATRTVGPTLGQDSVNKSIVAGIIGLSTVLLFMALYYRVPGVLAGMALCTYTTLIFALYKLIPVTLTLPGIAGLLLSIGMAVDANILIFERMKEELRAGKTLRAAIEAGFDRAWTSIWDSNLSTLLTCVVLFIFGSQLGASIVKGFAVTLAIGVAVSMFSAITVTRTFLRLVYQLLGGWMGRHGRVVLGAAVEPRV